MCTRVIWPVADAAAWITESEVQVIPLGDPATGEVPAVHLALDDATGDSAIIEYIDGKATVWHDRDYRVMTNSPTYDKQIELLAEVDGFGGTKPLPGTTRWTGPDIGVMFRHLPALREREG